MDLRGLLQSDFILSYLHDVRTLQETHLWTSTACYVDNYLFMCRLYSYLRGNTHKDLQHLLQG
jgi:hypothetical protein